MPINTEAGGIRFAGLQVPSRLPASRPGRLVLACV